jgi:fermentation-respiration switch protein FrsA (DUF1100 family)
MVRPFSPAVLFSGALLSLLGCCALEDKLLYYPLRSVKQPLPVESPFQDFDLRTTDGTIIHARWCPRSGSKGALLYCHGNAGNLESRGEPVRDLWEALGESVLIFDYPGFGQSEGHPSEAGCYAAASAAYDWLVRSQHLPSERIVLYGESLGGGVAVELASRRPHRALILVRTFTSIPDVAQDHFGWMPIRCLVKSRFDNLAKIAHCKQPIFIAQADADELIPFTHGQRLLKASGPNANFFRLHGSGHNDPLPVEFYSALRQFMSTNEDRRSAGRTYTG